MSTNSPFFRFRLALVVLLAALSAMALGSCVLLRRPSQPNVLWITMDSLRQDHLGCRGYERAHTPNIDALARQAALFTQSIAQSNYTRISVPSTITGKYPTLIDVRTPMANLDDFFVTLAELLSSGGYATYAILPDLPPGTYQGLETLEITGSSTVLKTQACMEILNRLDQRPFFIWLYYWDPHAPYQPPEEFATLFEPDSTTSPPDRKDLSLKDQERVRASRTNVEGYKDVEGYKMMLKLLKINEGQIVPTQAYRENLINLYDAEIAFVDSKIKVVTDKIKELGLWDNTMVVLNADHGEAFGEHDRYFHGYTIYEEEVRVPLIIKPPRSLASGKIIDGPVRNLDIMPTILDYCGISYPEDLDGRSLRPFIKKDLSPNLPSCIETNCPERNVHLVGYRQEGYKLICGPGETRELFDLRADPEEKENLLDAEKTGTAQVIHAISQKEKELWTALLDTYGMDDVAELMVTYPERKIDPELREKLKAQGYIY